MLICLSTLQIFIVVFSEKKIPPNYHPFSRFLTFNGNFFPGAKYLRNIYDVTVQLLIIRLDPDCVNDSSKIITDLMKTTIMLGKYVG